VNCLDTNDILDNDRMIVTAVWALRWWAFAGWALLDDCFPGSSAQTETSSLGDLDMGENLLPPKNVPTRG